MEIWPLIVDWSEVQKRSASGTLNDDLAELSGEESWVAETEFTDQFYSFTQVGRAYEAISPTLSPPQQEVLQQSVGKFLAEEPQPLHDLDGLDPESYFLALSPETVRTMANAFQQVDRRQLEAAFDKSCPPDAKAELEYSGSDFVEHVGRWQEVFEQANDEGRGLIVKVG